jgi:hypothetical protein
MDKWNWKILKYRSIELTFFKVYKYGCKKNEKSGWLNGWRRKIHGIDIIIPWNFNHWNSPKKYEGCHMQIFLLHPVCLMLCVYIYIVNYQDIYILVIYWDSYLYLYLYLICICICIYLCLYLVSLYICM